MTPPAHLPVFVDLCCGLGGWTEGFKEAGYYCIGVDIEDFSATYPGDEFIQADIRELDGARFRACRFMAASPPCDEFARYKMPWTRKRITGPPDLSIVEACYRIRNEAKPGAFILENVQSAQLFLGRAIISRDPFYLWGDVALVPARGPMKAKESYSSGQKAERAKLPFELAYGLALAHLEAQRR